MGDIVLFGTLSMLATESGLVPAGLEDFSYETERLQMGPGDL